MSIKFLDETNKVFNIDYILFGSLQVLSPVTHYTIHASIHLCLRPRVLLSWRNISFEVALCTAA